MCVYKVQRVLDDEDDARETDSLTSFEETNPFSLTNLSSYPRPVYFRIFVLRFASSFEYARRIGRYRRLRSKTRRL